MGGVLGKLLRSRHPERRIHSRIHEGRATEIHDEIADQL
jgi:hypothetical protein